MISNGCKMTNRKLHCHTDIKLRKLFIAKYYSNKKSPLSFSAFVWCTEVD